MGVAGWGCTYETTPYQSAPWQTAAAFMTPATAPPAGLTRKNVMGSSGRACSRHVTGSLWIKCRRKAVEAPLNFSFQGRWRSPSNSTPRRRTNLAAGKWWEGKCFALPCFRVCLLFSRLSVLLIDLRFCFRFSCCFIIKVHCLIRFLHRTPSMQLQRSGRKGWRWLSRQPTTENWSHVSTHSSFCRGIRYVNLSDTCRKISFPEKFCGIF